LLDRQLGRLGAVEDLARINRPSAVHRRKILSVVDEAAGVDILPPG